MNNITFDVNTLRVPLFESPFRSKLLEKCGASRVIIEAADEIFEKGYIIVDLDLEPDWISALDEQLEKLLAAKVLRTNSSFFSYNEYPRLVDGGSAIRQVAELSCNKIIMSYLHSLWGCAPIPFSSINFIRGTEQPLHSDTMHFGSVPKGFLAAAWVALEATSAENGAIRLVEGSHKWKDIEFFDLGLSPAKNPKEAARNYSIYEDYVIQLVEAKSALVKTINLRAGQALIWSANLLHGGGQILDPSRTRKSQVTHYGFDGVFKNFHPFYSEPLKGRWIERDLKALDIRRYLIND